MSASHFIDKDVTGDDAERHLVPLASMLAWANEDLDAVPLEFWIVGEDHKGQAAEKTLRGTNRKLYLRRITHITPADIAEARTLRAEAGSHVELLFSSAGRRKMARLSREHAGDMLGLIVDGQLLAMTEIGELAATGKALMGSDALTSEEADNIADALLGR